VPAAECFSELGWLAVADVVRNLAHRQLTADQHLSRSIHPYSGQVLTKSCVADLGKGTLKLAP
jgi:hypothetical protein